MSRLIVGIVGEIKAGKGMIEAHLKQRYEGDWDYTRFSAPLTRALGHLALPNTRENLQDLSSLLRQGLARTRPGEVTGWMRGYMLEHAGDSMLTNALHHALDIFYLDAAWSSVASLAGPLMEHGFGEDILAKTIGKDCERATKDCMIVDGVRRMADIVTLQEMPNFHIVYITAPLEMRLAWAIAAAEKVGDASLTPEKFLEQNAAEPELEIPLVGSHAHLRIDNVGTKDDVFRRLDGYLDGVDAVAYA